MEVSDVTRPDRSTPPREHSRNDLSAGADACRSYLLAWDFWHWMTTSVRLIVRTARGFAPPEPWGDSVWEVSVMARVTRAFTVAFAALLLVGTLAVPSVGTPPTEGLEIVKACPTEDDPAACEIISSTPFTELEGGRISYDDRVLRETPTYREIARVTLTGPGDDILVRGQIRFIGEAGKFTLRQGAGSLAGLHATGTVQFIGVDGDQFLFTLTGRYHIDPR